MSKVDLKKTYKEYYSAVSKPQMVNLPPARYISVRGKGDPSGEAFKAHIALLYPVVYKIKFLEKAAGQDFVIPPLEGLWWYDEEKFGNVLMENSPLEIPREAWEYRLMIRIPEYVTPGIFRQAREEVKVGKGISGLERVEWFELAEGECVQILHKGPFNMEPESLEKLMACMLKYDLQRNGLHHEIYLSDFRKTHPDNLKTILREPVK